MLNDNKQVSIYAIICPYDAQNRHLAAWEGKKLWTTRAQGCYEGWQN